MRFIALLVLLARGEELDCSNGDTCSNGPPVSGSSWLQTKDTRMQGKGELVEETMAQESVGEAKGPKLSPEILKAIQKAGINPNEVDEMMKKFEGTEDLVDTINDAAQVDRLVINNDVEENGKAVCAKWCAKGKEDWSVKCHWKNCKWCDACEVGYSLGNRNTVCQAPYAAVTDVNECRVQSQRALRGRSFSWGNVVYLSAYPAGCYCSETGNTRCYFNEAAEGQPTHLAQPVCKQAVDKHEAYPCAEYRVKFYLAGQHTNWQVPTCKKDVLTDGSGHTKSRVEMTREDLEACGECTKDGHGGLADYRRISTVNWNTNGCRETGICFNITKEGSPPESIGPADGLQMHPICAWGILAEMKTVYKKPHRGPTDTAGLSILKPYDPIFTKAGMAKLIGALDKKGQKGFVVQAAKSIDWAKHLSGECKPGTFRKKVQILAPFMPGNKKIPAVCWNSMQDFHDLYCNYKEGYSFKVKGQVKKVDGINMNSMAHCTATFGKALGWV